MFKGYHQLQKSLFVGHHLPTALNHPCHRLPWPSLHCSFSSSFSSFEFLPKCQHLVHHPRHLTHDPSTAPTHHMVTALAQLSLLNLVSLTEIHTPILRGPNQAVGFLFSFSSIPVCPAFRIKMEQTINTLIVWHEQETNRGRPTMQMRHLGQQKAK